MAGQELPEHYLVYFLLVDLLGFENLGKHEKAAWSIPIDLTGRVLFIEHRKLGLGVFSSNGQDDEVAASEIIRLIRRGIKVAQPCFDWLAERAVKDSKINVRNKSNDLFARFKFSLNLYEAKCVEVKDDFNEARKAKNEVSLLGITFPNYQLTREKEWLAISVIENFFSWTEHVFIHLAILQGKCVTGDHVKELAISDWKTKFKTALDINDIQTKRYYDELSRIRNQVRNFISHGAFGKDGEAFLFHSNVGAVPVKLPHHEGHHSY